MPDLPVPTRCPKCGVPGSKLGFPTQDRHCDCKGCDCWTCRGCKESYSEKEVAK